MLKDPHGGALKERYLEEHELGEARRLARDAKSWDLTPRQLCDVELLLSGAFSPLEGFMSAAGYEGVVGRMWLPSGALWQIPITLDVSEVFADGIEAGETIALRDGEGLLVAVLEVGETWRPDRSEEARAVYGTEDDSHPGVSYLRNRTHPVCVSGRVSGIEPVLHYDHRALRDSPAELRARFRKLGWRRVVGPKLIDRRSPHASASRGMVTFIAGRVSGDYTDQSYVRTHAQSRADIESPRARVP